MDSSFGQVAAPLAAGIGSAISPFVGRGVDAAIGISNALQNARLHSMYAAKAKAEADQQAQQEQDARNLQHGNAALIAQLYASGKPQNQDLAPIAPLIQGGGLISPGRPAPMPVMSGGVQTPAFDLSGNDITPPDSSGPGPAGPGSIVSPKFSKQGEGASVSSPRLQKFVSGQMAPVSADDARVAALANMGSPAAGLAAIQALRARQTQAPQPTLADAQAIAANLANGQKLSDFPIAEGGKFSFSPPEPQRPSADHYQIETANAGGKRVATVFINGKPTQRFNIGDATKDPNASAKATYGLPELIQRTQGLTTGNDAVDALDPAMAQMIVDKMKPPRAMTTADLAAQFLSGGTPATKPNAPPAAPAPASPKGPALKVPVGKVVRGWKAVPDPNNPGKGMWVKAGA